MKKFYRKLCLSFLLFPLGIIGVQAQNKHQRAAIKTQTQVKALNKLSTQLYETSSLEKKIAQEKAKQRGWDIKGVTDEGGYFELIKLAEDGSPIYYQTFNTVAGISTRANTLHSNGILNLNLNGEGMYAYVWDGGHARVSHVEYDGAGGTNRVKIGDNNNSLNDHSGHVIGTILASGYNNKAKGMAPYAKAYSYDWNSDKAEATQAASKGMLLSNHSYGFVAKRIPDYWFGAYIDDSRDWDRIMYNAPYYLMVVAAGNDGYNDSANALPLDNYSAYDKLTGHSTSKNNLVVANLEDAQIDDQGNLIYVTRNGSSSEGPTDDYRIKPDISGNGTRLFSTMTSSNNAYSLLTGTSMAAPNVTGTLLLLQQHYSNLNGHFMKSATLKGLALHTADDVDDNGPDAKTGWGLLNAMKAAQTISQNEKQTLIKELTLNQGETYTTKVFAKDNQELKVSISWTDPAGQAVKIANSKTPVLVNDLDLVVKKGNNTYYPWKLTGVTTNGKGENNVDPFERVDISNANGEYTITITHDGSLYSGKQNYTLIVTGMSEDVVSDKEAPSIPTNLTASDISENSTLLTWNESTDNRSVAGYEVFKNNVLHSTVEENEILIEDLTANTSYQFKVRAFDSSGNKSNFTNEIRVTTEAPSSVKYCDSKGQQVNYEYIQQVELNTIKNTSDGGNGYSNFTSLSTNLEKNSSYTLKITPKWEGSKYQEGYSVWIDFNHDGDFSDANENVFSKAPTKDSFVSGTIQVPTSALVGSTRMRVIMKYDKQPTTACETTFAYGEVEDYTINIIEGINDNESPSQPMNLSSSNITENSVTLNWNPSTDNVGVDFYNVYQNNTILKTIKNTSLTIEGLSANTTYTYQVSAVDKAKNESNKSNKITVTTLDDVNPNEYCSLRGENSSSEWIEAISVGGIRNYSRNNYGYKDFTNKVAQLNKGSNIISLKAGFSSSVYTEYWYVWVDINQDGTFSNSELLLKTKRKSSSLIRKSLKIPANALPGKTRMRIAMKYNVDYSSCGTFDYGEVEDYTVNISNNTGYSDEYETTSSFEDENEDQSMIVYPNPVRNGWVNFKSDEITEGSYEIIDMNGRLIKFGTFSGGSKQINVDELTTGKYFIRISKNGRKTKAAFLVQ